MARILSGQNLPTVRVTDELFKPFADTKPTSIDLRKVQALQGLNFFGATSRPGEVKVFADDVIRTQKKVKMAIYPFLLGRKSVFLKHLIGHLALVVAN